MPPAGRNRVGTIYRGGASTAARISRVLTIETTVSPGEAHLPVPEMTYDGMEINDGAMDL
jgi:hypothetical protein